MIFTIPINEAGTSLLDRCHWRKPEIFLNRTNIRERFLDIARLHRQKPNLRFSPNRLFDQFDIAGQGFRTVVADIVNTMGRGIAWRVWRAIKREVLHLVDQGYSDYQDIDRAWIMDFSTPFGPFGLMDIIGLDVVRDIEEQYYLDSGEERDRPPKLLDDMIGQGKL